MISRDHAQAGIQKKVSFWIAHIWHVARDRYSTRALRRTLWMKITRSIDDPDRVYRAYEYRYRQPLNVLACELDLDRASQ